MDIQQLLDAGFTVNELIEKGILSVNVGAAPKPDPDPQQDPDLQPEPDPQQDPDPQPDPNPEPAQPDVVKMITDLKTELIGMIQGLRRQGTLQPNGQDQQITLDSAIEGLYKGV